MGHWPLDLELLRLSPVDPWTLRQAVSGVVIIGATRSGKTTGPFQHTIRAFLRAGFGGVFFCVKPDATGEYLDWAKAEGRAGDVVLFGDRYPHEFNFLTYELHRHGKGHAIIENIVAVLVQAAEVMSHKYGHGKNDDYFENAMKQLIRYTLEVLIPAKGELRMRDILDIVQTLPLDANEAEDDDRPALQILADAERKAPEEGKRRLKDARKFFTVEWPRLPDRTRGSIASTLSVLVDAFLADPMYRLFSSGLTISPDILFEGKILVIDLPINELNDFAEVAAALWKTAIQKAILSRPELRTGRDAQDKMRPVFLAGDEAQYFISSNDTLFATTSASARGITVYASQSLELLFDRMGNDAQARSRVKALLGNLRTRYICHVDDPETTQWASQSLGQVVKTLKTEGENRNWSPGGGWHAVFGSTSYGTNVSEAEQLRYDLEPRQFVELKQGGKEHGNQVEAIVTALNMRFKANGQLWYKATFNQNGSPGWMSTAARITAKSQR